MVEHGVAVHGHACSARGGRRHHVAAPCVRLCPGASPAHTAPAALFLVQAAPCGGGQAGRGGPGGGVEGHIGVLLAALPMPDTPVLTLEELHGV